MGTARKMRRKNRKRAGRKPPRQEQNLMFPVYFFAALALAIVALLLAK